MDKVFIGLSGGAEDVLHMTFVAHQLKMETPDAEITWAISSAYEHLLHNNPDVQRIISVQGDWRTEGLQQIHALCHSENYDRRILFHEPPPDSSTPKECKSRLDFILQTAGVQSWLPRRPVVIVQEADLHVASEFIKRHKLHERNQRIIALEIQPDILPAPWSEEQYDYLMELLLSRLEVQILLCRGAGRESSLRLQHPQIIDARTLSLHQTVALLSQTAEMVIGARGGLTLLALAAGNTNSKIDLVAPHYYRSKDSLAACEYDRQAKLCFSSSAEEIYAIILEQMEKNQRSPLRRLRKHEVIPMNILADSDYFDPVRDPLISVLLLVRDNENELEGCLENIFSQDIDGEIEVIILDSGSKQNETALIRRLEKKYRRLRYIRSALESRYATLNRGIKPARGHYLFQMDPRNRLRPGALARLAEHLDRHEHIAAVWGDDELAKEPETVLRSNTEARLFTPQLSQSDDLITHGTVSPHLLWRSVLHRRLGMFNASFEQAGDYEFILRVHRHFPVEYLPGVVGIIKETPEGPANRGNPFRAEASNVQQLYRLILKADTDKKARGLQMKPPSISVILPTWGQHDLFKRALASVLHQTFTDYEIIVVNCSDTSLEEEVATFGFENKARYIQLHPDANPAAAWNAGLAIATGKWIAFLREEGIYYPEHLASLAQAAREVRQSVIYAGVQRVEGHSENGSFRITKREAAPAEPFNLERLFIQNFIILQSMLIEKRCFQLAGRFDSTADSLAEWELAIRLSKDFTFSPLSKITSELLCFPPEPEQILVYEWIYRRTTERIENQPKLIEARQKVLDELCRKLQQTASFEPATKPPAQAYAPVT